MLSEKKEFKEATTERKNELIEGYAFRFMQHFLTNRIGLEEFYKEIQKLPVYKNGEYNIFDFLKGRIRYEAMHYGYGKNTVERNNLKQKVHSFLKMIDSQ